MKSMLIKNQEGKPLSHLCSGEQNTISIENAYLTGKQSDEAGLIAEAVCNSCGVVVSKLYSSTSSWV